VSVAISSTRFVLSEDIVAITDRRKAEIAARHRPPDRVAAADAWVRSHKFFSLGVIIPLVLYFLTGLIKNVTDLIEWVIRIWK
jgi:hypothetical protein